MKTKVTILGSNEVERPEKKRIEFVDCIESSGTKSKPIKQPCEWGNISLLSKNWQMVNLDLMFAFDDGELDYGCIYIGRFNDGIV